MTKKEQDQYLKWAKIGVVAFLAWKLIKPLSAAGTTLSNIVATKTENEAIKASTGLTESEISLCRDVATQCYNAMNVTGFWQMSWFGGSTEDEAKIIAQLNRLSTSAHAEATSNFYQTQASSSLAADVNKYLSSDDRQKIKANILSNLR